LHARVAAPAGEPVPRPLARGRGGILGPPPAFGRLELPPAVHRVRRRARSAQVAGPQIMKRALLILGVLVVALAGAPAAPADNPTVSSIVLDAALPPWAGRGPHTVYLSGPVIANLDADPTPEIVVGTHDGWLYALKPAGGSLRVMTGWPQNVGAHLASSPAVADLDNDGRPEIAIGVGSSTD